MAPYEFEADMGMPRGVLVMRAARPAVRAVRRRAFATKDIQAALSQLEEDAFHQGETARGLVTAPLRRGAATVIVKGVPAEVCENCGEYHLAKVRRWKSCAMRPDAAALAFTTLPGRPAGAIGHA